MKEGATPVVEFITAAFQGASRPSDDCISADNEDYIEALNIRNAFRGKDWRTLSPTFIFEHYDALWHMTPEAFRYYLPAYLIASTDFYESDLVGDFTIAYLSPAENRNFGVLTSALKPQEREAIRQFLIFVSDTYPEVRDAACEALRAGWDR